MTQPEQTASDIAESYAHASYSGALFQFGSTLLLYALSLYAMFELLNISYIAVLLVSLVATAAYLRLFMIGHDCSHRSYMPKRWQNILVGNIVGVLTNTPVYYWGVQHSKHHRHTGNLDNRGAGDVVTMTTLEFEQASPGEQLWYRIGRNPWILMFIFAPIHFVIMQRWPLEQDKPSKKVWRSIIGTDLGICAYYGLMIWMFGLVPFLLVFTPVVLLSSTVAVWLFYIQHQFEDAYWEREGTWTYEEATLKGSSFYNLPGWLHWVTGNIGYHHIHHLNPRVPNYKLKACYYSSPVVQHAKTIGFWESFSRAKLALWDEANRRLISFRDYQANSAIQ